MSARLDRMEGSYDVIDGANAIRFKVGVVGFSLTVPPGRYWLYDGSADLSYQLAGKTITLTSLYRTLRGLLDGVTSNEFLFAVATPDAHRDDHKRGLMLIRSSGSSSFEWMFDDPLFTFPRELLGFPEGHAVAASSNGDRIVGTRGLRGHWVSWRRAKSKNSHPVINSEASTEDVHHPHFYEMEYENIRVRLFRYPNTPAVITTKYQGDDLEHTDALGLPPGEVNVGFEWVWAAARSGEDFIVVHDEGHFSDALWIDNRMHLIEVVRIYPATMRHSFDEVAAFREDVAGGRYDISLITVHMAGGYRR